MPQTAPISIIIPTYNYGHLLARAITSILEQAIPVAELIVIDDGSTDHTPNLMQAWLHQAGPTRVQYHHQSNQGPGAARNHGARLASQPWLLFLDADDELLPSAIASYLKAITQHPTVDVFFARTCTIRDKKRNRIRQTAKFSRDKLKNTRQLLLEDAFSTSTSGRMLLKTKAARAHPYAENIRHGEDTVMVTLLLANYHCYGMADVVVNIHSHSGSLRHQYAQAIPDIVNIVDIIFNSPSFPTELHDIRKAYLIKRLYAQVHLYLKIGKHAQARNGLHEIRKMQPYGWFNVTWLKRYIKSLRCLRSS